jgi:N-acyl homoserine lactone hydrolase
MNFAKALPAAWVVISCAVSCASTPPAASPAPPASPNAASRSPAGLSTVRLYALDCGRFELSDVGYFSDTGKPTGKPATFAVPCFVIRHPKGTLLWDTGFDEAIHQKREGVKNPVGTQFVDVSLHEQLAVLSIAPSDVTYVGFSHLHHDHAGNANAFASSTWLLSRKELEHALATPTPMGVELPLFSAYKSAKVELLDGDKDVFGDGTVVILQTPGHTAGHQSLVVTLEHAGTVVLSGDLAHTRENWARHIVPAFNYSREETLASMARVEKMLAATHGRFIVQHSAEDFASLPKFPAFLD